MCLLLATILLISTVLVWFLISFLFCSLALHLFYVSTYDLLQNIIEVCL